MNFGYHGNQVKLAKSPETPLLVSAIQKIRQSTIPPRNPYLAILRRDYPEPLIAILAFFLGIWLWDHYFGKPEGYAPGTEKIALLKIDRDLRLAETMAEDPAWLKWLAGVDDLHSTQQTSLAALRNLASESRISLPCLEALTIIHACHTGQPVANALATATNGQMTSDFPETSTLLANHQGTWWHAKLIESCEMNMRPACQWQQSFGQDSQQLKTRAIIARSAVWLLGLTGLFFLPATLMRMKRNLHTKPRGYPGAWPIPLGLTVFLVATLAWIGFTSTLDLGIATLPGLHPAIGIFLDAAARLLPSLIALALLFRRPSHAIRRLGLNQSIATKSILGVFTLLMIADQLLRWAIGSDLANTPGGGLSTSEIGLWGLAFTVTSACLLAPFTEEILYRGVLFQSLWNRLGVIPAAILSSAIFATLHFYDTYGLASVAMFGLSCSLLYVSTGSLNSTIALHLLYNSSIKIPEWLVYHGPLG